MKVKFHACNEYVLGEYRTSSDAKYVKNFTEEQIMNALYKSRAFDVADWFGSTTRVNFTITNIEKDKFGDYIYTVESNKNIPKRFFPSVYQICEGLKDVAFPISYSIE